MSLSRYASGGIFRNAIMPSYTSTNPPELWINYGQQYNGGVKFFGKASLDEITVNSFNSARIGFSTNDNFQYLNSTIAHYGLTRRTGNIVALSGYNSLEFFTYGTLRMKILENGNVGIGSANPDEKLTVKGKIHAEEVIVDLDVPADYVFQKYFTGLSDLKPDYELISLNDLEEFIEENHHLLDIPSADETKDKGLELGKMNNLLLQKIEELTLYILEQNNWIEDLENRLDEFSNK